MNFFLKIFAALGLAAILILGVGLMAREMAQYNWAEPNIP